jgi:thiol-disulfide isomerase/thioredoxin
MASKLLHIQQMRHFSSKTILLSITFILLHSLYLPVFSKDRDIFSRIGIQTIRDREKAPDFCLESLKGEKVQLKNLKGKVIFLNFWAIWCGPCKEETPSVESLH